jgi:hypothetical protein
MFFSMLVSFGMGARKGLYLTNLCKFTAAQSSVQLGQKMVLFDRTREQTFRITTLESPITTVVYFDVPQYFILITHIEHDTLQKYLCLAFSSMPYPIPKIMLQKWEP